MHSIWKTGGKRAVSLLLILLLVFTALPMTVSAEEMTAATTETVHLRAGAGTDTNSIRLVYKGSTVTVTDTSNPDWYAVKLSDGSTGYISSQYLASSAEISATTNEYVNLRSGTGTDYPSKRVVRAGTELTVTSMADSQWYAVRLSDGETGYIYSAYLDLGDMAPTATPKPEATAEPEATTPSGNVGTAITTAAVNLRSDPSTSNRSQGVVAAGTTVTITEKTNSEWYAVALSSGKTGYIFAMYLREQSSSSGETAEGKTTTYVNLRSAPSTESYTKGVIKTDTKVTITDRSNPEWYAVTLSDGRTGYIYSIYVEITEIAAPAPTAEPTAEPQPTSTPEPTATAEPTADPTATPEPTATPDLGTVVMQTTSAINLRKGPGTSYDRIQVVSKDVQVTVLAAAEDGWYKVQLQDGTRGYFISDYLELVSGDLETLEQDGGEGSVGEVTPDDDTTEVVPSETEYVRTTVSSLNLRNGAGTSYARIKTLAQGTVLEVLAKTSNGWIKVKLTDGTEGYVSAEYVNSYDPSSAEAHLPDEVKSLPQYKTLYIDADTSGTVYWSSSDSSVVTVDSGSGSQVFVYGVKPGTANIIGKNASGSVLTSKAITVTAPEAVRFAYTTPNIISAGSAFELKAVTDHTKSAVKFEIVGGTTYETTSYAEESNGSNNVRIFTAEAVINTAGTYTVRAYSDSGSGYSAECREFEILVVSTSDRSATTNESRLISDEMLNAVALFEGYSPEVYADTLAGNIPTVGYGYVVGENTTFYNSLTKTEAWAMLADTLNRRGYTTELNKFISANGIKMNQQQFDALVSFSYNVGAGYWNSTGKFYLRTILKDNTFAIPEGLSASSPLNGKVSSVDPINVYSDHSGSASVVKTLSAGQAVEIVEYYRNSDTAEAWYKTADGWVRSGDITLTSTSGLTRDLAYIDAYTFCNNLLDWHKAGGRCLKGLLTRRVAEAKVFSHGNYAEATKGNENYYANTYNYDIPDCV